MPCPFTDCLCDECSEEETATTKAGQQGGQRAGDLQVTTQPSTRPVEPASHPGAAESTRRKRSDLHPIKVAVAPLTKRNLRLLEKMARSKRPKITGKPQSRGSSKSGESHGDSSSPASETLLSSSDSGFERRLRQNGVVDHDEPWRGPPSNLDQLTERFHRDRTGSTVPSEGKFQNFRELAGEASNEREMADVVQTCLFKNNIDPSLMAEGYRARKDKQWLDYPKNQGFNNGLSRPRPDYVEGYKQSVFPPTISNLGGAVTLDNKAKDFIALPHFAAEFKARDAGLHAARVQAGYVGAAMSHGRSVAMEHLGATDPQKHAAVVTAVTDGMTYQTYAHFQDEDQKNGRKVYYQYPVESGTLDTYKNYQSGYRVLRNVQSFAQEQSRDIRERLHQEYAEESELSPSDD